MVNMLPVGRQRLTIVTVTPTVQNSPFSCSCPELNVEMVFYYLRSVYMHIKKYQVQTIQCIFSVIKL